MAAKEWHKGRLVKPILFFAVILASNMSFCQTDGLPTLSVQKFPALNLELHFKIHIAGIAAWERILLTPASMQLIGYQHTKCNPNCTLLCSTERDNSTHSQTDSL